jgi:hypothetical protein
LNQDGQDEKGFSGFQHLYLASEFIIAHLHPGILCYPEKTDVEIIMGETGMAMQGNCYWN